MITLKNLSFSYEDSQPILRDLNLTVEEGQVVCLTGPSGCGKTTLIRILNGLIPQYFAGDLQGEASINGTSLIDQDLYDISKNCGSVFQIHVRSFSVLIRRVSLLLSRKTMV